MTTFVNMEHLYQHSVSKYIPGCKLPVIQTEVTIVSL